MTRYFLLLPLLAAIAATQDVILPSAPGPYDATVRTTELNDFSRVDIFAPNGEHRRVMVSVFSPIPKGEETCNSRYMPEATAEYQSAFYASAPPPLNFSIDFNRFRQPICSLDVTYGIAQTSNKTDCKTSRFPLVFFGHAHTVSRVFYNLISQYLASYGFIVVNIDHPYDALIVEFPDGTTTFYTPETDKTRNHSVRNLETRTADVSFVLDQISHNITLGGLVFPKGVRPTKLDSVGIWGHSIGGATAVNAVLTDERFAGAINIDGALFGQVLGVGVDKPVVFLQDDDNNTELSWTETWPLMRGYKQALRLQGSTHNGMMDARLLADVVEEDAPVLGSIGGLVQINTLVAYARDFFAHVLQGKGLGLLDGPNDAYPQVQFIDL